MLRHLISEGVDVDSQCDSGTPLVWAAGHAQPDAVKVLLENKANVSLQCFYFSYIGFSATQTPKVCFAIWFHLSLFFAA